jgi:hypothetical protein
MSETDRDTPVTALREAVWGAQHDATCDDGKPHPWSDHLPWDDVRTEQDAITEADAIIAAVRPLLASSDDVAAWPTTAESRERNAASLARLASPDDVAGSGERLDGNIVRTAFGNAAADIGETHPSFFDVMADEITRLAAPTTEAPPKDAPQ